MYTGILENEELGYNFTVYCSIVLGLLLEKQNLLLGYFAKVGMIKANLDILKTVW